MKQPLAIFFFLFAALIHLDLKAQPLGAERFYGIDDFEFVYYSNNGELFKKHQEKIYRFYDIQLGEITSVDLINPLKILVFYRETQTVVLLDNRFNELERIPLSSLQPYRYIEHAALAGERLLWLHNIDENLIELYNYVDGNMQSRTPPLKGIVQHLYTDYNFCHVLIDSVVSSYNIYGSKTAALSIKDTRHLSFDLKTLVMLENDTIKRYRFGGEFRFRESGTQTIKIDFENLKDTYLKAGKLYLWNGKNLLIHHLEQN
ncbi:MAG: hypothetical protein WBA16_01115 [Nonlabens sp.]